MKIHEIKIQTLALKQGAFNLNPKYQMRTSPKSVGIGIHLRGLKVILKNVVGSVMMKKNNPNLG
jgi:hypothetical protein